MVTDSQEVIRPVSRNERLKTVFLSLSDENQTFILGQAEGLRVAQTLLPERLSAHSFPAQEPRQKPDGGSMGIT